MSLNKDLSAALEGLVDKVGEDGVSKLAEQLESRASASDKAWQSALLSGLANGVRREGSKGLDGAFYQLQVLVQGKKKANLNFMSYRERATLVSKLQKLEIRERQRIQSFLQFAFTIIKSALLALL